MTTNNIKKLDPALIRYGRITYKLELSTFLSQQIDNMIYYYYTKHIDTKYLKDNYITPSKLEMLCNTTNTIDELIIELDKELNC